MERSARNSSSQSQSSQPTPAANEMINTSLSGKRLSDLPSGPPSVAAQGNVFLIFFKTEESNASRQIGYCNAKGRAIFHGGAGRSPSTPCHVALMMVKH